MGLRPICFTIMPYGTKPILRAAIGSAPARVNFTRLWEAAIRPVIEALGYDSVRADSSFGAVLIGEMIERLATSDLVVADCTLSDADTFYQLGIRHALHRQGCVLISAEWARIWFDVNQMWLIRYPLPTESPDDATMAEIREILTNGIPALASATSPVFETLPGYPSYMDSRHPAPLRENLRELSGIRSALAAIRGAPMQDRPKLVLELYEQFRDKGRLRPETVLEILLAVRDTTDPSTTLQFIESLPIDVKELPLIREQRALAESKTGDHERAIAALRELILLAGDTSERRGLIGGRYKKLWSVKGDRANLDRAISEFETAMKLDLNDYYPSSNLARLYRVRSKRGDDERARVAATITMMACDRARLRKLDDEWLLPTLLCAAFDSGDVERARELAEEVAFAGPAVWRLETTIPDLELAASFHEADRARELIRIVSELKDLSRATER